MKKIDLIKMALSSLAKRKIRTGLTILSVVIGASSIIIMLSLGIALDENFFKEIESSKSITEITIYSSYSEDALIPEDFIDKYKNMQGVKAVTPIVNLNELKLVAGNKYVGTFRIKGIDPATMEAFKYQTSEGRLLSSEDEGKMSMVFGSNTIYAFYKKGKAEPWYRYIYSPEEEEHETVDVLKDRMKITTDLTFGVKSDALKNMPPSSGPHKTFQVEPVGILKLEENDYDQLHNIYMPYKTVERLKKEIQKASGEKQENKKAKRGYEEVVIKCNSFKDVENVIKEIEALNKEQGRNDTISSNAEFVKTSKNMASMVQMLLGSIGGISLFIAAIGIANTMVMSVYERTKEIGIMKVIGARVSDIKKLFLLEAMLIGLIGGFLGVVFSLIISFILNKFSGVILSQMQMFNPYGDAGSKISSIPLWLSTVSLVFSSLVGLIAGYLPAKKVVKIEALKAIKSD